LGECLEQQDGPGDCGVERVDRPSHRDPHDQVAAPSDGGSKSLPLAADDDRQRPAQIRLAGRERRVRFGTGDSQAARMKVRQGRGKVVHWAQEEMLDSAG
jgi:hypothetical protein